MAQIKERAKAGPGEHHSSFLEIIKAWLPVLTVVVGALWGLYEYIDTEKKAESARVIQAKKDGETRRIEAQKPFLELQFKTYLATTALIGQLVILEDKQEEFRKLRNDLEKLYWSDLGLVMDESVLKAVTELRHALEKQDNQPSRDAALDVQAGAENVIFEIRNGIARGWNGVPPIVQ